MKKLTKILIVLLFTSLITFAQENIGKTPQILGGFEQLIKNVKYPETAKEKRIEGTVFVKAVIDEGGNVESANVVKSVDENLDEAAISAVKKTKFMTVINGDGNKVKSEVTIPIKFKLDDCKKDKKES